MEIQINVNVHGSERAHRVEQGTTPNQLLGDQQFRRMFQLADNVEAVVDGASGEGDSPLRPGARVQFRTRASSKA